VEEGKSVAFANVAVFSRCRGASVTSASVTSHALAYGGRKRASDSDRFAASALLAAEFHAAFITKSSALHSNSSASRDQLRTRPRNLLPLRIAPVLHAHWAWFHVVEDDSIIEARFAGSAHVYPGSRPWRARSQHVILVLRGHIVRNLVDQPLGPSFKPSPDAPLCRLAGWVDRNPDETETPV
jgi:hypothetical protein